MRINHSKPYFTIDDAKSLLTIIESNFVTAGFKAQELGEVASHYLGKRYGIPTQSGTDALCAAFISMELPENAEVAVPAYICTAPLDALAICRLKPVPVDIDMNTFSISIDAVNAKKGISAVLAAHLFGIPAPLYRIESENLVEDCAQTLGVEIDGYRVGSMGEFAVCSFYGTKLLTTGHGGLLAVDDKKIYDSVGRLLNHDKQDEWQPHFHFMMSDLNASLGLSQFSHLDSMIAKRRELAERFTIALNGEGGSFTNSAYSRFIVFSETDIEDALREFNDVGIEAKRPVYKPLFQALNRDPEEFPNAQWAHDHIISVPIYPAMSEDEIKFIEQYLENHKNELRCRPPA